MEFNLSTSKYFYYANGDHEQIASLAGLGFVFSPCSYFAPIGNDSAFIVSTYPSVSIDTMDELMDFVKTHGKVIVSHDADKDSNDIEIYNGHREYDDAALKYHGEYACINFPKN